MSISTQADAVAAAQQDAALRRRAARQAVDSQAAGPAAPVDRVRAKVVRLGADKISMGVHVASLGDAFYERDEEFDCDRPIADALEERGYITILGGATGETSDIEQAAQRHADEALATEEAAARKAVKA